jgi:hypothetical protein
MCIRRETREKVRRSLAFPPISKPHTHITYMLRQCTSIVPYNVFFRFLLELVFGFRYIITKYMSSDIFAFIEYNITNSARHFGPNSSLWTGLSFTKYFMDETPVHKPPYGPQCHDLLVNYIVTAK